MSIAALARVQDAMLDLVAQAPQGWYRDQPHPDISPLGWHLGHCAYVEAYWIDTHVHGTDTDLTEQGTLFWPAHCPKPQRGAQLPKRDGLLAMVRERQRRTRAFLLRPPDHPITRNGYLARFLCGHHAQHLETMRLALLAFARRQQPEPPLAPKGGSSESAATAATLIPGGDYWIGNDDSVFDNERPAHHVTLAPCRIEREPVSNARFLLFMQAGGYRDDRHWSAAGRAWRDRLRPQAPASWRRVAGCWLEAGANGEQPLDPEAAVSGLCRYEAEAYAHWAGGRLPHEYEWEAAYRLGLLNEVGQVWEWCGNRFHGYAGFRPFPYREYSEPWFDGTHFVLRGRSRFSEPNIGGASFRNFYTSDARHIAAGLRVAYDVPPN